MREKEDYELSFKLTDFEVSMGCQNGSVWWLVGERLGPRSLENDLN